MIEADPRDGTAAASILTTRQHHRNLHDLDHRAKHQPTMGTNNESGVADDDQVVEKFSSPTSTSNTAQQHHAAARAMGSQEQEEQENGDAEPVSLNDGDDGNGTTTAGSSDAAHNVDNQGYDGPDEDSARMYGYEDTERQSAGGGDGDGNSSSSHLKTNQRMNRRNVVTAEAARFEISYHPGRVVSIVSTGHNVEGY